MYEVQYLKHHRRILKYIRLKYHLKWMKITYGKAWHHSLPPEIQYLRKECLQEASIPLVYMDECKCLMWDRLGWWICQQWIPTRKSGHAVVAHARNEDGFVRNDLLLFWSKLRGNYHDEMDGDNCRKYLCKQALSKCPKGAINVSDNASCHSVQRNKCPTMVSWTYEIAGWFQSSNITFRDGLLKTELLGLIQQHKP